MHIFNANIRINVDFKKVLQEFARDIHGPGHKLSFNLKLKLYFFKVKFISTSLKQRALAVATEK